MHRIHSQLIKAAQSWASRRGFNAAQTRELHRQAILLNHAYYLKNIPVYQKLAGEEGVTGITDVETIKKKLMFPDDIFKSYSQEWLDTRDFASMNRWLSWLYHRRLDLDVREIKSIDDWLERLYAMNIYVTYSSGTSGSFSFIPRDKENLALAKTANICYLAPLLTGYNVGTSPGRFSLKQALSILPPEALAKAVDKMGLPDFDAFFLGFKQGRMGNQMLMQELAPVFRRHFFLYDIDLTATALRCLRRGARTAEEQELVEQFQDQVVSRRDVNYLKIIEHLNNSIKEGQKVFLFGAPYQFKELCELMSGRNKMMPLNKGSLILFGGGWKSFTGETMKRDDIVKMISDAFDLPPEYILEGYSMTEVSMLMLRCGYGRFHIPPVLEPAVFDEELNLLEGREISGTFGFLDPLASSYPGFIISGDHVHLVDGECRCGLSGPAVTEIGRSKSREVKGCGGIMGSLSG